MTNNKITQGNIYKTLLVLMLPQIGGFFAITAFNFADTWFVSQLDKNLPAGAESLYLSSISLTFPIVFGVGCIAIGIGIAITTLVSRAIGNDDRDLAQRIVRDGFILVIALTLAITVLGLCTIDPLFKMLGAKPEQMPVLRDYMTIWYYGAIFMLLPMTGNNALRGAGNTFWPGIVMVTGSVLNIILDPILIYGYLGFPAMGVKGAALATVISRSITAVICLYFIFKSKLIAIYLPRLSEMLHEYKTIFTYAFPAMGTKMIMPLTICIYNIMAFKFGKDAVAALNMGARVEQFALLIIVSMAIVLMIFLSQNLAAGNAQRARKAINFCYYCAVSYSVVCYIILYYSAVPLAEWFNNIKQVQDYSVTFIYIRPLCYPLVFIAFLCQHGYFALGKPFLAILMEVFRLLIFSVTLAWIGGYYFGYNGMITGIAIGTALGSIVSIIAFERAFRNHPTIINIDEHITESI